jgi:hypothetical protein
MAMAVPGYFPVIGFPSRLLTVKFPGSGIADRSITD